MKMFNVEHFPTKRRRARFEIFKDVAGKFRWRLVAGNGETMAQSEAYTRKYRAISGAFAVVKACAAKEPHGVKLVDLTRRARKAAA